ncbi:MAG: DUF2147 domain-containing protein [Methylobacteriaceae bacterium]|nr:DUF2147 domain-containing protein [Methylobacteriaceae bacterium]
MHRGTLAGLAAAIFASTGAAAAGPEHLVGTWMTESRDSKIRVAPCGRVYCATVVWAKTNSLDARNPDPGLRRRGTIGMQLTKDMRPAGDGSLSGSIYNPEDGKTYSASMNLRGTNDLEVSGCVLGGLICGSETWKRDSEDTASAAPAPH